MVNFNGQENCLVRFKGFVVFGSLLLMSAAILLSYASYHGNLLGTRSLIKKISIKTSNEAYKLEKNKLVLTNERNQTIHPRTGIWRKHNGTWAWKAGPKELYAYTAFYDDRVSLGTLPVIRIIAVAEKTGDGVKNLFCKIWRMENDEQPYTVPMTHLDIGAGVYKKEKWFREIVVGCQLPSDSVPYSVSIINHPNDTHQFQLPVEVPEKLQDRLGFVACVSVTYWRQDSYRIIEWMEMLRILGVSLVTIYNNTLDADASRIFQYYDRIGFVDFRQSHNFINDSHENTIHLHMSPVINDCIYRNMYRFNKVVVTDLDELIIPRIHMNYSDMIENIEKEKATPHPARSYTFLNDYFFFDIPGNGDSKYSSKIKTLHYRKRCLPSNLGYSAKSIIDPRACTNMHNHYCWGYTKLYDTKHKHIDVSQKFGLNQHYKKCHFEHKECLKVMKNAVSDDTMLRFKEPLLNAMRNQINILKLDPL